MAEEVGGSDTQGLLERDDAILAMSSLLERLEGGRGGSLFFIGEAGLGKTTVLRRFEREAWSHIGRCMVGRADGVLFGSGRPFRLADQIFASLGIDVSHSRFAGEGGAQRSNRFLAAIKALDECSSHSPVLLLLDDLHWSDPDSLAMAEFLCRQLEPRTVAIVGTLRPWPPGAIELARNLEHAGFAICHELRPLGRSSSEVLMASRIWGDIDRELLENASSECAGNPFLIEEVARSLLGGSNVPAVEPFSFGRRSILLRRFAGVSEDVFKFLRAASALGTRFRPGVVARMVGFDVVETAQALDEARTAGVVDVDSDAARFRHPLFATAVYEGLQEPLRTELHEAAFRAIRFLGGAVGDAAEQALMAGLTDDVAVQSVRQAGLEALEVGAWQTATRFLGYAASTTGSNAPSSLVCDLAEAYLGAGSSEDAVRTIEALISRGELDERQRGRALVIVGNARLAMGLVDSPFHSFEEAARVLEPVDRSAAVNALLRAAHVARLVEGPRRTLALSERAAELACELGEQIRTHVETTRAIAATMLGRPEGLDVLAEAAARFEGNSSFLDHPNEASWWPLVWCGSAAASSENFEAARRAFDLGYPAAERRGWPAAMGAFLLNRMDLLYRLGELDEARAALPRFEALVELAPVLGIFVAVMRALLDLSYGSIADAQKDCAEVEYAIGLFEHPPPIIALWGLYVRAEVDISTGNAPGACDLVGSAENMAAASGIQEPCVTPWWEPAIDAYHRSSRYSDLERVAGWLDRTSRVLPCRWPKAGALVANGLVSESLGDPGVARRQFEDAVAMMDSSPMVLARARLLGWYGAFLRRQGELADARRVDSESFSLAESRGARLLANAARAELRLAGGRLKREERLAGDLTARQAQVEELASTGHTNAEIAEELGIAKKTVEHHLETIYRQLGVKSRRELMRRRFASDLGPQRS